MSMMPVLNKFYVVCVRYRPNGNSGRGVSAESRQLIIEFMEEDYILSFHTSVPRLSSLLPRIPMEDNIFVVYYENGFNILQKCVAENNMEAVKVLITRNPDLNSGPCSLVLHIACLKGYVECVEFLIEHGARLDVKARMCWPGPHCEDCPGVRNESRQFSRETTALQRSLVRRERRDKIQNAFYYAIDGKQNMVLQNLLELQPPEQISTSELQFMLQTASSCRAWSCSNLLLGSQAEQLDCQSFRDAQRQEHPQARTVKYLGMPLDFRLNWRTHIAAKRAPAQLILNKLYLLLGPQSEVDLSSKALVYKAIIKPIWAGYLDGETETAPEMTLFHVLFFMVKKSAALTLKVCRSFLAGDLKAHVSVQDYLGKTPLHSLIVRYAFEESRTPWLCDYEPWGREETKEMIMLLLEHITVKSLNTPENCALTFVIRYIEDWEFIYELLTIFIEVGADPTVKDSLGLCPLIACITKLVEDDIYATADARTKEFFIKSLRLLCSAGADPNAKFQELLTPLYVLIFTISENFSAPTHEEMCNNFDFLRDVLALLLEFGLDANGMTGTSMPSIYYGVMKMMKKSKYAIDVEKIQELVLVLLQYGLDPNLQVRFPDMGLPFYGPRNPFAVAEFYHLLGYMFITLVEKDDILNENRESFTRILYLLYTAMDHRELYKCLTFLHNQFPLVRRDRPCQVLFEIVRDMLSEPRSLKHSVRVVINRLLHRKPGLDAHRLNIPKKLKNYLISYKF